MPATANCNGQGVLAPKLQGGNHVGYVGALHDQARFAANHPVMDFPSFFVAGVAGRDEFASKLSLELANVGFLHDFLPLRCSVTFLAAGRGGLLPSGEGSDKQARRHSRRVGARATFYGIVVM